MKLVLLFLAALLTASCAAQAQSWPDKPVTLVVAYPAGGGVDPVARLLGKHLSERWKQPVIVANKAGASGTIGAAFVAKSKGDGLNILVSATPEVVINQYIMKDMQYDPEKDLRPVTLAVRLPFALVAHPKEPFANVAELVAHAKKNPGKVSYASSGEGTLQHLSAVMLEQLAAIQMLHVPYKGVAPSVTALLGGEVAVGFAGLQTALPHIKAGTLKGLAVSSATPSPAAPGVPPLSQTPGLQSFDLNQWFGIFVPASTPTDIVRRLQEDVAAVLQLPEVRQSLESQGTQPGGMPTAQFESFVRAEREKFSRLTRALNVQ